MANHKPHPVSTDAVMEKPLFRNLIGVASIVALFYFANKAFTDVIDDVVESKYEWVAERFALSVGHIHKEWLFNGKPNALRLTYHIDREDTVEITVQLNKPGWPLNIDPQDRELNCMNLWMLFAHEEGHRKSMLDLTSHLWVETKSAGCEFYHREDGIKTLIFSYNLLSGKIDTIKLD